MPALVLPQFFLCGLLIPRDDLPSVLHLLSDLMPLSYAVDAMPAVSAYADPGSQVWLNLVILTAFIATALTLGSLTLRRCSP
ncbi:MAG: ABC transporter permease [Candidatus Dormibacteraeota bacterium]|nr:ABC transporter permease [Candidatus Dormibacteraeota bacterium]